MKKHNILQFNLAGVSAPYSCSLTPRVRGVGEENWGKKVAEMQLFTKIEKRKRITVMTIYIYECI